MRWDLESRKLAYKNEEKQFGKPQVSFEQELDNLKTILANGPVKDRGYGVLRKKQVAIIMGIVVLGFMLGMAYLYLL